MESGETDRMTPLSELSKPQSEATPKRTKRAGELLDLDISAHDSNHTSTKGKTEYRSALSAAGNVSFPESSQTGSASPTLAALPIRKKQKRGTASAASDCFACAERGVSCDRQRPYCGQCLQLGQKCPGYRTTLTWGVGVASRGKLRGSSCPIASKGKPTTQTPVKVSRIPATSKQAGAPLTSTHKSNEIDLALTDPQRSPSAPPHVIRSLHLNTHLRKKDVDGRLQQANEVVFSSVVRSADSLPKPKTFAFSKAPTAQKEQELRSESSYAAALDFFPSVARQFHDDVSESQEERFHENPWDFNEQYSPSLTPVEWLSEADRSNDNNGMLSSWDNTAASCDGLMLSQLLQHSLMNTSSNAPKFMATAYQQQAYGRPHSFIPYQWQTSTTTTLTTMSCQQAGDTDGSQPTAVQFLSHIPSPVFEEAVGSTPRLKYLIRFFMEAMAPVMVTFNKPRNPYTTIFVSLARTSQTLQYAIAALAANNFRRKRENWQIVQKRRTLPFREASRQAHAATQKLTSECSPPEQESGYVPSTFDLQDEANNRNLSIKYLNSELADPVKRYNDSVLASLLLVCLYDACDTGLADFRSQFAGVKKLLALRRSRTGRNSEALKWCARMFVFYDCTTATVNDRNLEFGSELVEYLSLENDEWTIGNTFGCDARLFRLITQLDDIYQLRQGRCDAQKRCLSNPTIFGSLSPDFHDAEFWRQWYHLKDQFESWSMQTSTFRTGFAVPYTFGASIQSVFPGVSQNDATINNGPISPGAAVLAPSWQCSPPPGPSQVEIANLADLSRISECFRYSALLYVERLAYPDLPSSHPRIQHLVHTSMHYISSVESAVSLLWPMFVTGSECISETHREIIRSRCNIIYGDAGFFNSVITLGLLENIWAGMDSGVNVPAPNPDETAQEACTRGSPLAVPGVPNSQTIFGTVTSTAQKPFRWLKVIASGKSKGEYIVG
ncbi:hypothetical protein KEM54_005944 [Ascosphaera aggregata]|nr:hypothetical protein KEM54_005944 [Ascosphaera aggregata]